MAETCWLAPQAAAKREAAAFMAVVKAAEERRAAKQEANAAQRELENPGGAER